MSLCRSAIGQYGLKPEQEIIVLEILNRFPEMMADLIASEAARMQLIPVENVNEITLVLAEMFKEEHHAELNTNN